MPPRPILSAQDPRLREEARPVRDLGDPEVRQACVDLRDTLADFRARHGFGRGIAAPQIGVPLRLIVLDLGAGPKVLVNPRIIWRDPAMVTLWDDCMCFPGLVVKLRRHLSVSVHYYREDGTEMFLERLPLDLSELIQHEVDHLDAVLALDRAHGGNAVVQRRDFEAERIGYLSQVDFVPGALRSEDPGF